MMGVGDADGLAAAPPLNAEYVDDLGLFCVDLSLLHFLAYSVIY